MSSLNKKNLFGLLIAGISCFSSAVSADQQYASRERATIARAHVSRARALLVEALAEFEESKKYARPDMLIDSEDWRLRVISLTEQLNRVVDPKPRVTREGAVFRTPPRFVKREKEQLPEPIENAKSRSDIGEKLRMQQKQQERAKFFGAPKANDAKSASKLPSELQLPEEPILDAPTEREASGSKPEIKSSKNLFSNDLMPEIKDNKNVIKMEGNTLVNSKKSEALDVVKESEKKNANTQEIIVEDDKLIAPIESTTKANKSSNTNSILPPTEESLGQKEIGKGTSKIPAVDESFEDDGFEDIKNNPLVPPAEKKSQEAAIKGNNIGPESVPTMARDDEASGVSQEETAKQMSEDEDLAKKLEDSISKKLSDRVSERN